jgi:hypothetical protein
MRRGEIGRALLATMLTGLAAAPLDAQEASLLRQGAEVRLESEGTRSSGVIVSAPADSLVVRVGPDAILAFRRESISDLRVRVPTPLDARSAAVGALVGAGAGVVVIGVLSAWNAGDWQTAVLTGSALGAGLGSRGRSGLRAAPAGLILGAAAGAVLGYIAIGHEPGGDLSPGAGAVILGVYGGVLGGAVAPMFVTHRWDRVDPQTGDR